MIEWQPIDTAPKDGTRVVLRFPSLFGSPMVVCGYFDDDKYARRPKPFWSHDKVRVAGVHNTRAAPPTHWAPINMPEDV